jgi:uncharacterized damage-inducible protein DinB
MTSQEHQKSQTTASEASASSAPKKVFIDGNSSTDEEDADFETQISSLRAAKQRASQSFSDGVDEKQAADIIVAISQGRDGEESSKPVLTVPIPPPPHHHRSQSSSSSQRSNDQEVQGPTNAVA